MSKRLRPCCVQGCDNKTAPRFKIPANKVIRKIWIKRSKNQKLMSSDDKQMVNNYPVCKTHFADICFDHTGRLKKFSLPTLNLPDYDEPSTEGNCFCYPEPEFQYIIPEKVKDILKKLPSVVDPTASTSKEEIGPILEVQVPKNVYKNLKKTVFSLPCLDDPVTSTIVVPDVFEKEKANDLPILSPSKLFLPPSVGVLPRTPLSLQRSVIKQTCSATGNNVDNDSENSSSEVQEHTEEVTSIILRSPQIIRKTLEENNEEFSEGKKCRTCLNTVFLNDSTIFTDLQKEMLSKCIPEMEVVNTDHICGECSKCLEIGYQFIIQCQKVEIKLKKQRENKPLQEQNVNDEQTNTLNDKSVCRLQNIIEKDKGETTVDETLFENVVPLNANNEQDNLAEKIQCKLRQIRAGFPNLNIVAPSTELDNDFNFKVTTNTRRFALRKHLNVILSLPYENDLPLPEKRFDLSSSLNTKKRILLLSIDAKYIVSCYDCLREVKHPTLMEKHKTHCSKFILKCSTCNKRFFNKATLRKHKKCHKISRCTKCKIQFTNKDELKTHKYYCEQSLTCCNQEFQHRNAYLKHRYQHHWNREKFLCDICGKSFKTSGNLCAHKKIHTAPTMCSICKRVFKNKITCSRHINYEHRNSKHSMCEQCGLVITKTKMRYHLDMHDQNRIKKYNCEFCPKQFYTNYSLTRHVRLKHTYQGILKYACDKCEERFSRSDYLKRHIAQHMREANRFNAKTREM